MSVSYNVFTRAFLSKVSAYDFADMSEYVRMSTVDEYMKRAIASFRSICKYDLSTTADDVIREFDVDIPQEDLDEIADIVSEGMLIQWMKPFVFRQEGFEQVLNTRDFTTYSPAELLMRVGEAHKEAKNNFTHMKREYSYVHGDLTSLHQ